MKPIYTITFLFVCLISSHAQTTRCKPISKENKNKILLYTDIETNDVTWRYHDVEITRSKMENGTTYNTGRNISITQNNTKIAQFRTYSNRIADSVYVEYHPNGNIKRYDSLLMYGGQYKWYWDEFHGNVISAKEFYADGLPKKQIYYRLSGRDSLTKKWYPGGQLNQSIWGDQKWGTDSSTHTWDESGILTSIETRKFLQEFYPTGIVKTLTTDTVISKRPITCKKEYFPSGKINSVAYYYYDTPCHTWTYYTEKGTVEKTVNQTAVSALPEYIAEAIEGPSSISKLKETEPEYKGQTPIYEYINAKLIHVMCNCKMSLSDVYTVQFTIDYDGGAVFENITGKNSQAIQEPIKDMIKQMPTWKPATKNGKPVKTTIGLKLHVLEF